MSETITPLIQQYIVDFASNNNFFFIKGIQGDGYGTRYAELSLSCNGSPYIIDAEKVRVVIYGTKPDNLNIFNQCEIVNSSTIRFEITTQMLAVPGKGDYKISVISLTENRVITSFPFFIICERNSFDAGVVTSSNEFLLLISKINTVDSLVDETTVVINNANMVINNCIEKTEECLNATNNAIQATTDLRALEESIETEESKRVQAETLRQTNTATAIQNAQKATSDAIDAYNDLKDLELSVSNAEASRVEAENLRQTNTANAISNAEKATSDAISAKNNANAATAQAQQRIDEYDSLNVSVIVQNAETATSNANTATANAIAATESAQKATNEAIQATIEAKEAVADIKGSLGIDDTKESTTSVWSSSHTHDVIIEEITSAIENNIKSIPDSEVDLLFSQI